MLNYILLQLADTQLLTELDKGIENLLVGGSIPYLATSILEQA